MKKGTVKDLFDFIVKQVHGVSNKAGVQPFRAFPRWFAEMYFSSPEGMFSADGTGDGKVDFFFHTVSGKTVTYHAINSKFTETYNQMAPVGFYDEVLAFYELFNRPEGRRKFMQQKVKAELRPHYQRLFDAHKDGKARLLFLTNCRRNDGQCARVEQLDVTTFHLEDLVQHVLDDLDGAMPHTPPLVLNEVSTALSPPREETGVSTTIIFARLIDFVEYMDEDPYDLLFARNVRVYQGSNEVNRAIFKTFRDHPDQFAYSNNGITLLCEQATHDHATRELRLVNPRVVNGCQTLFSVRAACSSVGDDLSSGAKQARVMVRVVCVPPPRGTEGPDKARETKEIVNRISIRSNQQNPIKPWDLRANDEFQMELTRRFRRDELYYERRAKEWKARSRQLKGVGIALGPSIKSLMAAVACYYWKNPKLGPVEAKGHLGDLFQGDGYDAIREDTTPDLAYQIYVVSENVRDSLWSIRQKKYVNARAHLNLAVLSLAYRALSQRGAAWKKPEFTFALDQQWDEWDGRWDKAWQMLTRAAADLVLDKYAKAAARARRHEREEVTLKNFVRRKDEINRLLSAPLKQSLSVAAKSVLSTK